MPFTPLHMGPGLALKAVLGRYFSLMVFGFTQVAMDLEPLVRLIRGDAVLHGFTHTYLGATLIGAASVIVGRPACEFLLDRFRPDASMRVLVWLRGSGRITWTAAIVGALTGAYSHVGLDSIMHADMHPLAPMHGRNALLSLISVDVLHVVCVFAGVLGAAALLIAYRFAGQQSRT